MSIVEQVAHVDRQVAVRILKSAGMKVSVALIMLQYNISRAEAAQRLKSAHGIVRKALQG